MAKTHRTTISATQAKNQFGEIMRCAKEGPVYIEKHGRTEAVVLDAPAYEALLKKARDQDEVLLDELREEFDAAYQEMQTAASRSAADLLLSATPAQLNKRPKKATKRRG